MDSDNGKTLLGTLGLILFFIIIFGIIWFFFVGNSSPVGFGWYLFSFASGLTMIVLACTFPLIFVIVPLSMGKGPIKGLLIALSFGLGVVITLSLYGVLAAILGTVAINSLGISLENIKNWLYLIAGIFAYLFALGELGLMNVKMPTYTGAAPAFIQKQEDYLKAFLLGLFLGNIGIGCPHPATPIILTRIAVSGSIWYGWLLFLVHAIGRILPLILIAILGIIGVNALSWIVARKEKIEKITGWGMIIVAGFILTLGLFTHDWWVASGQHTLLEQLTQEELVINLIAEQMGVGPAHQHDIPTGTGLFGLPLWLGNWVLIGLWLFPFWLFYRKKKKVLETLLPEQKNLESEKMSWRFWNLILISLLLILIFVYVLPDRFLNQTKPDRGHSADTTKGIAPQEMMMADHNNNHKSMIFHEEDDITSGPAVNLTIDTDPISTLMPISLNFFVSEQPDSQPIPIADLQLEHTKLMHVVGVRQDLNSFFHIHPEPSSAPGLFATNFIFSQPGTYKIWSEIKKENINHTFGHRPLTVVGTGSTDQKEISLARNIVVGDAQVALHVDEPVIKNKNIPLDFTVSSLTGGALPLNDYLGAKMHLVIIKDDWGQFLHTHPASENNHHSRAINSFYLTKVVSAHDTADKGSGETFSFPIVLPEAGFYKIFAQFHPSNSELAPEEALLASFWIKVVDEPPVSFPSKNLLVIIALILMAGLSLIIHRLVNINE